MTAIVMKCEEVNKHPNADALMVYKFVAGDLTHNIIANLENKYEVGDNAVIVLAPCTLLDGTKLNFTNIRGVPSPGMAFGKIDKEVGTDLTSEYCKNEPHFYSWPDIEPLFNIRKYLAATDSATTIEYQAKIKLDGTNAGVQCHPNGTIVVQSRSKIITPSDDNMGFARWVSENKELFSKVLDKAKYINQTIIVFGEWCGQGIQKKVAISEIGKKVFAVFALQQGFDMIVRPHEIVPLFDVGEKIFVLPWATNSDGTTFIVSLDFTNAEKLKEQAEQINSMVAEIEICDPWVEKTFGVKGIGEGIVLYPVPNCNWIDKWIDRSGHFTRISLGELIFKAKGEAHKVVKTKQAVQIDPEVANSIAEFVTLFVTEARLEQIAQKVGGFDQKATGQFVKDFTADVLKESKAELEASNLTWEQVSKGVNQAASKWWITKCKQI